MKSIRRIRPEGSKLPAMIVAMLMLLAACSSPVAPTSVPTVVSTNAAISTTAAPPDPTATAWPTSTATAGPTVTPASPQVTDGAVYYIWSDTGGNAPYVVWGARLRDTMNGGCQGFICGGVDLRDYDAERWQFLGRGDYGTKVFDFPSGLDTFVVTYRGRIGFDALSGTTPDGKTVTYGYLADKRITASYMDGSAFPILTIVRAEERHTPVTKPCGIIDPNPDGDGSFNLSSGPGGIVWSFLDQPWGSGVYLTRQGYTLVSLRIVAQPANNVAPDHVCP